MQLASSPERTGRIGLLKRASYGPTSTGGDIASNTLTCFSARLGLLPPIAGADPPPRWTLRRLVGWLRERFGRTCCRETIRAALHRPGLSWKKAKRFCQISGQLAESAPSG